MQDEWGNLPEAAKSEMARIRRLLHRNARKQIDQSIENAVTVLREDPLFKGALRLNELIGRVDIVKNLGWRRDAACPGLTDTDLSYIKLYMERFYNIRSEKVILDALSIVARGSSFHPIRECLEGLKWDGRPRIRHVLHHFLGAEESDLNYEIMKLFLLGSIHRLYCPGCKFETMLCLVGAQGLGKSTFFRFLAMEDNWFSDDLRHMDDKNVYRQMEGHWIIEMAEMLGTTSAKSVEEIKSFLSRQKETYKVPYERYQHDHPRQCVFVGTTNKQRFLPLDRTGNRRFCPVQTDVDQAEVHIMADEAASRKYMRQVWAEAMVIYRSGNLSLKLPPAAEKEMDIRRLDFMAEDTTTGVIQAWLDKTEEDFVCTRMIYNLALDLPGVPDRRYVNEINDVMNNTVAGWLPGPSSHRFAYPFGTQRAWHRSDRVNEPAAGPEVVDGKFQPDTAFREPEITAEEQLKIPDGW